MNRRQFVWTAAGAGMFASIPQGLAADKYDLVIKGGRVIDPARRMDAMRDVAISGGRIATIQINIEPGGAKVIDAHGKLVVPGLIDIHTHAARTNDGPGLCLADGVTGFIEHRFPRREMYRQYYCRRKVCTAARPGSDQYRRARAFCRKATPWISTTPMSLRRVELSQTTGT